MPLPQVFTFYVGIDQPTLKGVKRLVICAKLTVAAVGISVRKVYGETRYALCVPINAPTTCHQEHFHSAILPTFAGLYSNKALSRLWPPWAQLISNAKNLSASLSLA
jgi:hypothetical protein